MPEVDLERPNRSDLGRPSESQSSRLRNPTAYVDPPEPPNAQEGTTVSDSSVQGSYDEAGIYGSPKAATGGAKVTIDTPAGPREVDANSSAARAAKVFAIQTPSKPLDTPGERPVQAKVEPSQIYSEGSGGVIKRKLSSPSGLSDPYNARYPYNHVTQTESGHLLEFDDTPGHERINIEHRSGAFIEIHPDGHIVIKANKFDQEQRELTVSVEGDAKFTVGGDLSATVGGDAYLGTVGNLNVEVTGNLNGKVFGRTTIRSTGYTAIETRDDIYVRADGQVTVAATKNVTVSTAEKATVIAQQDVVVSSKAAAYVHSEGNLKLSTGKDLELSADGNIKMTSKGTVDIVGSSGVNTNGGAEPLAKPDPKEVIPAAIDQDEHIIQFAPLIGEVEHTVSFDRPSYTAIGPNGEVSPSKQADSMMAQQSAPLGSASRYAPPKQSRDGRPTQKGVTVVGGTSGGSQTTAVIPVSGEISGPNFGFKYSEKPRWGFILQEKTQGYGEVKYQVGGKRSWGIDTQLEDILKDVAKFLKLNIIITSGGQIPKESNFKSPGEFPEGGIAGRTRTGSARHDRGFAADIVVYDANGRLIRTDRPEGHEETKLAIEMIKYIKGKGVTAVGAGPRYMSGSTFHVDMAYGKNPGALPSPHWGEDNSAANSPPWFARLWS